MVMTLKSWNALFMRVIQLQMRIIVKFKKYKLIYLYFTIDTYNIIIQSKYKYNII